MTKAKQGSSRKQLLIDPPFQLRFMAWMGGLAVLVLLLMHGAHAWFFKNLREQAELAGVPSQHVFYRFIRDRQAEMNAITLVTFIAVVVFVAVIGLILSHKIAGPIHRLKSHLANVPQDGDAKRLEFREGDYFLEIPEAYNLRFDQGKTLDDGLPAHKAR